MWAPRTRGLDGFGGQGGPLEAWWEASVEESEFGGARGHPNGGESIFSSCYPWH